MARLRVLIMLLATLLGLALPMQVANADAFTYDSPATALVGHCVSTATTATRPLLRPASAASFTYDVPTVAHVGAQETGIVEVSPCLLSGTHERIALLSGSFRGASTTLAAPVVATNTGGFDLYHGTDADSAQDIVENGLSQESAGNLGGGDGDCCRFG